RKERDARVLHLPIDLTLSGDTAAIIDKIRSNADKDFRIARTKAVLQSEKEEAKRMAEQAIVEKNKKRYSLLRRIFDEAVGNANCGVPDSLLQEKEGLTQQEFFGLLDYLKGEGLVNDDAAGVTSITHQGIIEIEASIAKPNSGTDHFTPMIIQ